MAADEIPESVRPGAVLLAAWLAVALLVLACAAVWVAVTVPPRTVRRAVTGHPKRRGAHAAGRS